MKVDLYLVSVFQLLGDDGCLLGWLTALEEDGLSIVVDAPKEKGAVTTLCKRVAHERETNYGYIEFIKALSIHIEGIIDWMLIEKLY